MSDRDCDNCAHHSEGGCSVWECSFEQREDDTISRLAAIGALCGWCQANCIPCESFPCGEIKAVQALPSAQPTQTDTSNTLKALDCVERRAAIDALRNNLTYMHVFGADRAVTLIEELPSAQPERKIHFADADHVWIDGKQYISLGRFQEAVVEAQTERKTGLWIETEGLDEEIRCTMCTNPMRSDRGCDGSCQYNEKLYKCIMSIIKDRIDGGGS